MKLEPNDTPTPSMVYKKRLYKKHSLIFQKMEKHGLVYLGKSRNGKRAFDIRNTSLVEKYKKHFFYH